jgi:hypothetical protein
MIYKEGQDCRLTRNSTRSIRSHRRSGNKHGNPPTLNAQEAFNEKYKGNGPKDVHFEKKGNGEGYTVV